MVTKPDPDNPSDPSRLSSSGAERAASKAPCRSRLAEGFLLGALLSLGLSQLGVGLFGAYGLLIAAVAGSLLARTRVRVALWVADAGTIGLLLVVTYTPAVRGLMGGLERRDPLRPAPAVVVLGSAANKDRSLTAVAQERVIQGYVVLRQGYAPRLVLTRPVPEMAPWDATVNGQMRELGLEYPVDVVGPVLNTHDEAVAVAALARERGWDSVILVTHSWHMRRAAAAFEKAGLHVICCPCVEGTHDLHALNKPGERPGAFRYWLHETVGYRVYRLRGWV